MKTASELRAIAQVRSDGEFRQSVRSAKYAKDKLYPRLERLALAGQMQCHIEWEEMNREPVDWFGIAELLMHFGFDTTVGPDGVIIRW